MKTYPHICPYCKSPARKSGNLFCSNVKCKSWKKIRKTFANFDYSRIKYGQGMTSDDPIIVVCPNCDNMSKINCALALNRAFCRYCYSFFEFIYEADKWYRDLFVNTIYTTYYRGNGKWDWMNGFEEIVKE